MTLASELMARGVPAGAAELIGQDTAATGLTATGSSSQANAYAISSKFSIFSTVAANSGAILPARGRAIVVNGGANSLSLYPPVGGNINGGSTNAAIAVPAGKSAICESNGLTWGVVVSA
jgi:hypothetical protein